MDDETIELIRQLCTRAGTLMEDASAQAILIGGISAQDLNDVTRQIAHAADEIMALNRAAQVLLRSQTNDDGRRRE